MCRYIDLVARLNELLFLSNAEFNLFIHEAICMKTTAKFLGILALLYTAYMLGQTLQSVSLSSPTVTAAVEKSEYINHLADSFSPYLRQHMHNPVDWYPWGEEALAKAKAEDKPILVSIGYSTCYWCHVLERETFSDPEVAKFMNEHFVSIKVDREVRPDIDEIYMAATQMFSGRGGWPNNVLLTPDLKPFFAVTYLPRSQWMGMLQQLAGAWKSRRREINASADKATQELQKSFAAPRPLRISMPVDDLAGQTLSHLGNQYDGRDGGFGTGTKFPMETNLLFLLEISRLNGAGIAMGMVTNTVDNMIAGGIHDHVGGGFHRYSTETSWTVPHFEKMLYTQGLMASVLSDLYSQTHEAEYKRTLERLLRYVQRDMTGSGGAFFSAEDAETDAVEGDYYVWNTAELKKVLGQADYDYFMSLHETRELPHYPGHLEPNGEVLRRKGEFQDTQRKTGLSTEAFYSRLDSLLDKLLASRSKRKRPLRDEKIIASWNGMMMEGFANAGRTLDNPSYVQTAEKAARFILKNMRITDGGIYRIYMNGKAHQPAVLEDYAWLSKGLMAIYRATGDEFYMKATLELLKTADRLFLDEESGGYYMTDGSERLPVRLKKENDAAALPAANSVMLSVFADLYAATGNDEWMTRMDNVAASFGRNLAARAPLYGYTVRALMEARNTGSSWIQPVTAPKPQEPSTAQEESKDKVSVRAHIVHAESSAKKKVVDITVKIDEGWHLNANPASMDFLIPTTVNVQTGQASKMEADYPKSEELSTSLGSVNVYQGTIHIKVTVNADQSIDEDKLRLLMQVQACKESTCYAPSQITMPVRASKC